MEFHPKCIIKNCSGLKSSRGLCANHYASAAKLIKKGRTTWEYLIKHDLALESGKKNGMAELLKTTKK